MHKSRIGLGMNAAIFLAAWLAWGMSVAARPQTSLPPSGLDDAARAATAGVERRVYEGVASWRKQTIGTLILIEGDANSARGWIRLNAYMPIESGKLTRSGAELRAGGNTYQIDESEQKITYSGPEGEGRRLVKRLTRWTGHIHELLEATERRAAVAKIEVAGRNREMQYGTPALWKQQGAPFEKFPRLEEVLSKEVSVWVGEADLRYGRLVVVEEPAGMNIPLKAPKEEEKKEEKKESK